MIMRDDLITALVKLTMAPLQQLCEPEHGYAIAGFSFDPATLFHILQQHVPSFTYTYTSQETAASRPLLLCPCAICP